MDDIDNTLASPMGADNMGGDNSMGNNNPMSNLDDIDGDTSMGDDKMGNDPMEDNEPMEDENLSKEDKEALNLSRNLDRKSRDAWLDYGESMEKSDNNDDEMQMESREYIRKIVNEVLNDDSKYEKTTKRDENNLPKGYEEFKSPFKIDNF